MRWIFRAVLGLFVLVLVAGVGLLLLPAERIAKIATERFEAATGRAMVLEGDVRPTLWPVLGVQTGRVEIANAPWSAEGPMLKAAALSVGVDALSLVRGNIRITQITADEAHVLLETDKDGTGNWVFATAPEGTEAPGDAAEGSGSGLPALTLDKATLRGGSLRFIDHRTGADHRLAELDLDLAIPSMTGETVFDLKAVSRGQPLRLSGRIQGLAGFLQNGAVPVVANLALGPATAAFDGRAGLVPVAAAGRVTADLKDLAAPMALLGLPKPGLPRGLGAETVALSGDVTFTDATLNLRNAALTLDNNSLTAAADLSLKGEKPVLNAKFTAAALDLSGVTNATPAEGSGATATAAAGGWPTDPIDVSGLHALDATVALVADSVRIGTTQLGRTDLLTTLENGRAVTQILDLRAYDGRVDGSVVVNARGGLSARADLSGSALAISSLMAELLDYDRVIASGDLAINLLGVGNDLNAIMHSLEGSGRFATSAGELRGLDLAGMLRTMDLNYMGEGAKTIFDKISGSFTVQKGVLSTDDLTLLAPLLSARGAGTVGLGEQTLDLRIAARLLGDQGIEVPVLVSGPWAAPKVRLDLEGIAKQQLKEQGPALEKAAKARAKEKIASELGVEIGENERIEDALRGAVEEKAKKGLLKLLGGN
ncbi:AsmA family protein [Oceaniglobus roseus]|uniref:AsmA family protein n=1 Tax=Oceaniglobus roseus TaxID=1737570 RepID=UPI000C7F026D|nr:AsmA family protein [Kandeliimicrobium roseum]